MAILGVLLGITMCAVAWAINESRHHQKLIIDLQNRVIFDMGARVSELERQRRKAVLTETVTSAPKPAGVGATKLRTWNEDAAPAEPAPHRSGYEVKHG